MKRVVLMVVLVLAVSGVVVSDAAAIRFADDPCPEAGPGGVRVCPQGVVGANYSVQLQGAAGCGPALPYQYRILSGALPAGLSLARSGLISGTPTAAGTSSVSLEISDEDPPSASWCFPKKAERDFTITIIPGLTLETTSVPPGTLNVPYSATLTASPAGTQTWSLTDGTLPPGLTLGATTGVITGTPTTIGSFPFAIKVSDSENRSSRREFRIDIRNAVTITTPQVRPSEVGVAFRMALVAAGGTGTYTWSLSSGALPPGVALGADGTIVGTPGAAGAFRFTATATDTEGRKADYPGAINVAQKLAIATRLLRPARVGHAYRQKVVTTGGVIPTVLKVTKGPLPRGIHFDRTLGVLSGTPTKPGTYRITFDAVDALKVHSTKTLKLVVTA